MAKSNQVWVKDKYPLNKKDIAYAGEIQYNFPETVLIRCLIDAQVRIRGTNTGNIYVFSGAGSLGVNEITGQEGIDIRDQDEILNKKRGRSCCGESYKNLFELV